MYSEDKAILNVNQSYTTIKFPHFITVVGNLSNIQIYLVVW